VAQRFKTSISIEELASAASQGLGIRVVGDTANRIQLDAGGKVTWGGGASAGDANLYRASAGYLTSDGILEASGGLITLTTDGEPVASIPDGALAIDTTNDLFYFRSNSTWQQVSGGGGASVTVSDDAPLEPEEGDLWFESDTGDIFVYYDSVWVDVGGSSVANIAMSDTAPTSPTNGDFWFETDTARTFVYYVDGDSSQWVEVGATSVSAVGDDGYVQYYSGGGLAGASALYYDEENERVGIKSLDPQYDLHVAGSVGASAFYGNLTGDVTGNADTATALETARTIELTGDVTGSASFDGTGDIQIDATVTAEVSDLDSLSDVTITSAADGELLIYDGSEWVNTTYPTSEPMGHEDKTQSTISFDSGSLTFSIAPVSASHTVWCKGRRYVKTTTETLTIPNTAGLYYISYDENGSLQYELTYFEWHNDTPTAYLYWNGSDYLLFDERHGIALDWATHEYLHRTRGAVIANGFGASNYVENGVGDDDAHMQLDIADGTFFDEDLQIDILHSATPTANTFEQVLQGAAEIPMIYRSGTTWVFDTATEFPLKQGTALPTYNLNTGGTWSSPDLGNGSFGVTWIVATNILGSPIIGIMGQDEYNNIGQAEAVQWTDVDLQDFPVVEMRPLYKVAYEVKSSYTNTPSAAIRGVYDYRRYGSTTSAIPAQPVADHGSLTGLADDDHPQYFNTARHDAHDHSTAMSSVVIYDISNVSASAPASGDYLKWDGLSWTDSPINLGTDTLGDYVESLVAGTGVTLSNNTGEGATPTVEIGQAVGTTDDVIFNTVTADLVGNADTATALATARTISLSGDVAGSASFDGTSDITISATVQADSVELGTDTTGDYIESISAGTGITIYNGTGEGASAGIAIGQDVATTADVTFNDLILTGNLTVQGTTTTLETATLQVEDNIIVLNYGQASPVLDGGIEIDRGSGTNVLLRWNEGSGYWEFTNNGTDYFKLITTFDDVTGIDLTTTAPTSGDFLKFDGTNWVPDQIPEINTLNDIGNVSITSVAAGDFLKWSGSAWVNDAIDLGTDTTGDYVANLIAGTGVTIYNGTGQSASATIEIGQAVGTTDDVTFNTVTGTNGVVTLTSSGAPTATADDGAIAIDTANNVLYIRSGGAWVESSGGASVTISDTPPAGPEEGDLWYESDTGATYVYYDSAWIEIGAASSAAAGDEGYVQYYDGGFLAGASAHYWDSANERLGIKNTTPAYEIDVTGTIQGTTLIGTGGVVTLTTSGVPTETLDDGAIAVDTANDVIYIRSNGAWVESSGGASVTVSDTAPADPEVGDLWYNSTSGATYVYYDSAWVEVGASTTYADGAEGYVQYYSGGVIAGASAHYWDAANERLGVKNTTPSHEIDVTGTIRGTNVIGSNGVTTLTTDGAPSGSASEGTIAVDNTNDVLYIYSNGAWVESSGGASVTVSDTAPTGAEEGDLWYKSDVGTTLVYYDGTWVEITGSGSSSAYKLTSSSRDAALLIMEIGP